MPLLVDCFIICTEPEKKTHSSNTSAQATPSPATINPIAALTCVLITAFVLYVYFGGLRSSVVIGAVIVALMATAYFYNTPAQVGIHDHV